MPPFEKYNPSAAERYPMRTRSESKVWLPFFETSILDTRLWTIARRSSAEIESQDALTEAL